MITLAGSMGAPDDAEFEAPVALMDVDATIPPFRSVNAVGGMVAMSG